MVARVRVGQRVSEGGNYFSSPKTGLQFYSSGCRVLDLALGGGWAEGRIGNIIGDKSTGKTLLCIEAAANFAIKHPKAKIRYRESEAAFDEAYAGALGMPLSRVDFGEPLNTVEDFFEDLNSVIKGAKGPELYILDSLDALSDRAEMERNLDEGTYGTGKSKNMSEIFRRITKPMQQAKISLIIVSQIRSKIGVSFGRTWSRSGGRALDFYASQVLFLAQLGTISREVSGVKRTSRIKIKAKVDKNKVGLPFREAEFQISFGFGIDDIMASLLWLKEARALSAIDVGPNEIKAYIKEIEGLPNEEYAAEVQRVHAAVEKRWYEIEDSFMPKRQKYNVGG